MTTELSYLADDPDAIGVVDTWRRAYCADCACHDSDVLAGGYSIIYAGEYPEAAMYCEICGRRLDVSPLAWLPD